MPTLSEILTRLRKARAELIQNREADALRIAFDHLALLKLRIQRSGNNADGRPFAPYTEQYAKERKGAGYQVDFVDFTRTGRMWAAVQPRVTQSSVFTATVLIEGQDDRSQTIIAGQVKKRGNILRFSKEEEKLVRDANTTRIRKYVNQIIQ